MLRWKLEVVYVESRMNCWSCGQPGSIVGGHSWLRKCETCDVTWSAEPPGTANERTRVWQRGNTLDKIAGKFGLGNREGFVDHAEVKLASPG
jgi:hypothetical protein